VLRRLGLLALTAVVVAAPAAGAANPTIYFNYKIDCTFTVSVDGGGSTASLPPGVYQVWVGTPEPLADDPNAGCPYPLFQLTGPGVNITTDLSSGGETVAQFTATFAAGATYVAQDNNQPATSRRTVGIATSGSASSLVSGSTSSTTATSGGSKSSSTNQSQSVVGSAIGKTGLRGTLAGSVSAQGAPSLTRSGKPVTILESGRYTFVVQDHSPKTGFVVEPPAGRALTVTGAAFVGTKRVTLTLTRGQWSFGPAHAFLVTS
jgi:hypothetical protein